MSGTGTSEGGQGTPAGPSPDQQAQDAIQPEDLKEVQGIVLRGFTFPSVRYFVLEIKNAGAFKKFLGQLDPGGSSPGPLTVTSSVRWTEKPDYALAIGLSYPGIQALGYHGATFGNQWQFQAFKEGAVARAASVGDRGPSDPANWTPCLTPENAQKAHVILTLYAIDQDTLESRTETLRQMFTEDGAAEAQGFGQTATGSGDPDYFDARAPADGKIHFGYEDGIAQPNVMGVTPDRPPDKQQPVPAYEVVIQENPSAPYVFPQPSALTKNGTFSAFRILEQDVAGFESYLNNADGDPELLAAKFCGRWRNGNPLELFPDEPGETLPISELSNFDFFDDPQGARCPISSHIRRSNPRDSESFPSAKPDHRITRRAKIYGPAFDPQNPDEVPRGLIGHFIGASLENTFEFIMRVWVNGQNFADNFSQPKGNDPLLGDNSSDTSVFDYPPNEAKGFEAFVTTRGGLYVFLPSLPALTWMANN